MKRMASCLAALLVWLAPEAARAETSRYKEDYFTNRTVTNQDGKVLRFYDDVIKNKIVIVSFIFTSCTDLCPLTTARLAEVQRRLGDRVGRDIFFVSLSVDPETDTPERLKAFADAFGAGPGWQFLTGRPEDMTVINRALGDRSRTRSEHRNEVVLGNDRTGEWARDSTFGEFDRLVMEVYAMDPAWRDGAGSAAAYQALSRDPMLGEIPNQAGQALFKKVCSSCHSFGVGDRTGPDLFGVTERRDGAWLARFLTGPEAMRASGDPVTNDLVARFPGVRMPDFGLGPSDASDLIEYLKAQNDRILEARKTSEPEHAGHHGATHAADHHAH